MRSWVARCIAFVLSVVTLVCSPLCLPPSHADLPAVVTAGASPRAVSVEVLSYPALVGIGDPIAISWRISGGSSVSQTRVEWGLQPGGFFEGNASYQAGGMGDYAHTFSLPYAATVYFQVSARVDGADYASAEHSLVVACEDPFAGNIDREHAAAIEPNRSYTGCPGPGDTDWYVVSLPGCTTLEVSVDPAPGPIGGGQGAILSVYDAEGHLIGYDEPYCGGGLGRCPAVWVQAAVRTPATVYLAILDSSDSYELSVNTSGLALHSDEFRPCSGPSDSCWAPWYWDWADPLGDTGTDRTREGDVWWMRVPGGGTHDLHETTDAPRLMQAICGDFAVESAFGLSRSGEYQSAGLLVWKDAHNFFRWELNDAGGLRALRMRNGAWTDSGNLAYVGNEARLQLQRVGPRLDCFAYVLGEWRHYGSWDLTSSAVEVGLHVVNYGNPGAASASFDYFRAVSALPVPVTPTPTAGTPVASYVWRQEAESGTLTAPMTAHAATEACGGAYVASPTSNSGEVSFSLSVPQAGNYYLWARVRGNDWTGNSFFVAWDTGSAYHYEVPQFGDLWTYGWDQVHPVDGEPQPVWLTAGAHTLRVSGREPNAALDALLLTNDPSYVPNECATTPTPTATPTPTGTPRGRAWLPLILRR